MTPSIKAFELNASQSTLLHHFKGLGVNGSSQFQAIFSDIEICFNLEEGEAKVNSQ
jgi:hypothetical protein